MANIIEARVRQKTDTLANWNANQLTLLGGEAAFVLGATGEPVNFRLGDGTKKFSELPNWIQYDQAAFIKVATTALPTPTIAAGYSIVGEGTYTKAGQANVVVPAGSMGILDFAGGVWSLSQSILLPIPQPVTKANIAQYAYVKEEYVNQVLIDTITAETLTVDSVSITNDIQKKEWLKKLDQCFKSFKVFGLPEGKFILIRQFSINPTGNLGIGLVVADSESEDINVNLNNNGFVAVTKDYSKPFTIEFRERYREHTYLITLDLSPLEGKNIAFNFRDSTGISNYKKSGIKYTSVSKIPKKNIWGTGFDYTNGSTEVLPQAFYFHEAIKLILLKSDSNELVRCSGFSYDAVNSNIIMIVYSCIDDAPNNLDVVPGRTGYSTHRFTIPLSDRGVKRYSSTRPVGSSTMKGDIVIDLDYIHSKLTTLSTTGLSISSSNNRAQWILSPSSGGGGGIVTSLIIVGGGDSFQGNFSFNPTGNWAVNASGNMSKLARIPEGTASLDFNLSINGVGYNILFLDKDFKNLGWGYDGTSGTISSLNITPPSDAVFFLVCTSSPVESANVTANGSFEESLAIKTYRTLADGLGDVSSGYIFIVKNKYFRKLKKGLCTLSEYTPIDGGWIDSVNSYEKNGVKIIPSGINYSNGSGIFTGGVLCSVKNGVMYFYNNSAKAVYKSSDNGITYEVITDKFSHPNAWTDGTNPSAITDQRNSLVIMDNGDILIPIREYGDIFANTNNTDRYERYWSMWKYSKSDNSMTKCFEFSHESYVQDWDPSASNYGWPYYSSGCMLGDFTYISNNNMILITEYGEGTSKYWYAQGQQNNSRGISGRAWVSFDYGVTWKIIFDADRKKSGTEERDDNWFYFSSTTARKMCHMHGISYDDYEKVIYLTNGDNEDYKWGVSYSDLLSWYNSAIAVDPNESPIYKDTDTFPSWSSNQLTPTSGNSSYAYSSMRYQMMQSIAVNNGVMLEAHDASREFAYISYFDDLGEFVFEPVFQFEQRSDFDTQSAFVASWVVTDGFAQQLIKHNGVIYLTHSNGGTRPSRVWATIDGYKWKMVYEGDNSDIKFAGKILFDNNKAYLSDGTFGQASNTSGFFNLSIK